VRLPLLTRSVSPHALITLPPSNHPLHLPSWSSPPIPFPLCPFSHHQPTAPQASTLAATVALGSGYSPPLCSGPIASSISAANGKRPERST
jgi:hypothetical protein